MPERVASFRLDRRRRQPTLSGQLQLSKADVPAVPTTPEWVAWFNHHRLMEPLGYIPPAEAEANEYLQFQMPAA